MNDKLSPGDLAIIIDSVMGKSIGQIVQCVSIAGDHSEYGQMWLVSSNTKLVTEYGGVFDKLHVPTKWLKKIKPGDLDHKKDIAKLKDSDLVKDLLQQL